MAREFWTEEQEQIMARCWGKYPISTIVKKTGKTMRAVRCKAVRMGYPMYTKDTDLVTLRSLAILLGYGNPSNQVDSWIRQGVNVSYKKVNTRSYAMVDLDDFWDFIYEHKDEMLFRNVDTENLGAYPDWLDSLILRDKYNKNKTYWTTGEVTKALSMKKIGYSNQRIAEKMNRNTKSINALMFVNDMTNKELFKTKHKNWSKKEEKQLLKLIEEGKTHKQVGEILGRSTSSIDKKIVKLRRKK